MHIGAAMFFTDYSMAPGELALALEERGFESVWSPEHSHIPLARTSAFPSGGELPKKYYDAMDPFVALTAAAVVTKNLRVGTGICLVAQRDPIQTSKLVSSIDQLSGGRFLFGVGNGWNSDEIASHGTVFATRHKVAREPRCATATAGCRTARARPTPTCASWCPSSARWRRRRAATWPPCRSPSGAPRKTPTC